MSNYLREILQDRQASKPKALEGKKHSSKVDVFEGLE